MNIRFLFWKLKAILVGLYIFLTSEPESFSPITGCCLPNGSGDLKNADLIGAGFYRIPLSQALNLEENSLRYPYLLLMENLEDDGPLAVTDFQWVNIATAIKKYLPKLKVKPYAILCTNEQNDISDFLADCIREYLPGVYILKGPYSSCVENAGLKKYYEVLRSGRSIYWIHTMNFYLKPHRERKWFQNLIRKSILAYLVTNLRKLGVIKFIITEAHDGSCARPGFEEHGDLVYASKEGWREIYNTCYKLGIEIVLYYQAPFLTYPGNEM